MGLLDDAIRQHLDLKRRHGADPGDVAKLEHEVFGPVEREDALTVPASSEAPLAPAEPTSDDALVHEEEAAYDEAELEAEESWAAAHPEPTVDAEPRAERQGGSVRSDPDGDVPVPAASPPHGDEPDPQPDPEPAEHDELEQTPEFLQETPEHDRLWFEQKPPRDFDF